MGKPNRVYYKETPQLLSALEALGHFAKREQRMASYLGFQQAIVFSRPLASPLTNHVAVSRI